MIRLLGLILPRGLTRVHHFLAWLGGYYWINCRNCGRGWGGHQRRGHFEVCPRCAKKCARRRTP